MPKVPQDVIDGLVRDMRRDPGLPRDNPTGAFWQLPPAINARTQSEKLPTKTTYAVIGSGITGCSVSKHLLEQLPQDSQSTVTVFEARTLTSGATGRNGGHLLSPFPEEFLRMKKGLGLKEAVKVSRFANRTLKHMHELAAQAPEELQHAAEVRHVRAITSYRDQKIFEHAKSAHAEYERHLPECQRDSQAFDEEQTLKMFGLKNMVGAIEESAGAFWPYRLITGMFAHMQTTYKGRFSIETETPVLTVSYEPKTDPAYPYVLNTPRGIVRATQVAYCTNGWTGAILPQMRGKIYPLRGTMSTQVASQSFPREGDQKSWSMIYAPQYDKATGTMSSGLYYITQNATSGDIFIGGEKQMPNELFNADDTQISTVSSETLQGILPSIFATGWTDGEKPDVRQVWSGIMGFTPDFLPWVGQVPLSVSGRAGQGEWIAAGFNGYGMPLCWGCGEAIASMMLGKTDEIREWFPDSLSTSASRLHSPLASPEVGIALMVEQLPRFGKTIRLAFAYLVHKLAFLLPSSRSH